MLNGHIQTPHSWWGFLFVFKKSFLLTSKMSFRLVCSYFFLGFTAVHMVLCIIGSYGSFASMHPCRRAAVETTRLLKRCRAVVLS